MLPHLKEARNMPVPFWHSLTNAGLGHRRKKGSYFSHSPDEGFPIQAVFSCKKADEKR